MIMKKTVHILFFAFSLGMIIYSIVFIVDYTLIIKYSIETGFSDTEIIFPKIDRRNEIDILIRYSIAVLFYIMYALVILWYSIIRKN